MKIELNSESGNWFGGSVILKLALIGFLTLILLIPNFWIQDLISERQERQTEINKEIANDWSGKQLIEGPVLVIPYKKTIVEIANDKSKTATVKEVIATIHILPENLNMDAEVKPTKLHRGIFESVVYTSKITVNGSFSELELKKSGINPEKILWDKAKVFIGISDLKGLKNNPQVKIGGNTYEVEPDFITEDLFDNNLSISPDLSKLKSSKLDFSLVLDLKGSEELNFLHIGKNTKIKLTGNWADPSFIGRYSPDNRSFKDGGFTADWNLSYFNRNYPQQWEGERRIITKGDSNNVVDVATDNIDDSIFGVKFILPVDQYQKTMRTAKYAILIIMLTFIALFFMEFIQKRKIHLLQYVLISAAMIVYYTLLLAFGEQVGFNYAYLIASVSTIVLIGSFVKSLMKAVKPALLFSTILSVIYGFIFVIIQLQDLALLSGSIALFVVVALLMFLSGKIDWNKKEVV
ncbi:cell envelope integrity protein CreD [Pedobacter alpinus]|uniref:Cell envelope integrity protein CreD n=1 Tax=Pedobacter alpinus TaxID=1590643 RepID=A0ABW5TPF5_9SPHI